MAQPATKHKPSPQHGVTVFKIALLGVVFSFVVSILQVQTQIADQQAEIEALNAQIVTLQQQNAAVRDQVENGVTQEYLASLARSEYDYVQANERVYIDSSSN